uniref:Reverse transcriptase Ty1/copia-type domain-containing protein n=1 Tax=Chenopodium quinoa TaxID=63459 RepID=A0A803KSV8_CHEQI
MNKTQTNPESGTSRTVGVAGKSSFSDNTNWCNHCGGTKHTKKGCFELVEYHRQKAATKVGVNQTGGKANVVVYLNPENKDSGNEDNTSVEQSNTDEITSMRSEENTTGKNGGDEARKKQNIKATQTSRRNQIQTANGEYIPVTQAGKIDVTSDIHLNNCLLIPSLTHKLLSDALTGEIIGRGTERGGLYYVDEVAQQGNALLAYGSPKNQLWMWHRRCYDPIAKRVHTTLDCEFFEQTYYYTQLSPQGENLSDDLSWLTYPEMVDPDPTTQVGNTIDAASEAVDSLPLQSTPDYPVEHPSDNNPSEEVPSEEVPFEQSPVSYNMPEINPVSNESEQNRYEFPPRSTRGVPPRRYDPAYEDQRSRYLIEGISTKNLSSTAIAFNASLYSADIPKNVEEAVKNEKWKQAMEEEKREKITCLIIYVDDMIITGNDEEEISDLKRKLFQEFEMKDLGNLKYFLGIEVLRSKQGIFIHQRKYILDLLAETGMLECKPAEAPIMANHGLQILEGANLANKEQYQKLVGKVIYLAHTRPDIAYAVGVVSRFMHLPQIQHMTAVMRILRYLKGTSSTGIYFDKNDHLDLIAYTDADGQEIVMAENRLLVILLW